MPSELGGLLAKRRGNLKLSLREVERRTGIHNAHLSQIETGAIERPDPGLLWELAELYQLDFRRLMKLAGHVKPGRENATKRMQAEFAFRAINELPAKDREAVIEYLRRIRAKHSDDESQ